jgi:hypothetical protein
MNKYLLKHKDIIVAGLLTDTYGNIAQITDIYNKQHLPVGSLKEDGALNNNFLPDWWNKRGIPGERQNLHEVLDIVNAENKNELLIRSSGLSLTDHYWIIPEKKNISWEEVNFYKNDFSRDIGNLFFKRGRKKAEYDFITPDVSSDGMLPKWWDIASNGKRILFKGGSEPYFQEPFNEIFVSLICEKLDINHVKYHLEKEGNFYYSVCENMTDENTELIYASKIYDTLGREINDDRYTHYVKCCDNLGIKNIKDNLDKMIALDYIIANTDRHWNNFGLLRDSNTLAYKYVAPIFDSGTSLWNNKNILVYNRENIIKSKCFADTNYQQLKFVSDFSWYNSKEILELGDAFKYVLMKNEYLNHDRKRVENLVSCFKNNIQRLDIIINEKYSKNIPPKRKKNNDRSREY